MRHLITFIPVALVLYSAASFVYMDPNPANWGTFDRVVLLVTSIAGTFWAIEARKKRSDDERYPPED